MPLRDLVDDSGYLEAVMAEQFGALQVARKTGQEQLRNGTAATEFNVLDFWQWLSSDLVANALRGRFAEYIVACALGLNSGTRVECDAYDLRTACGLRLEVKSAAYLQSWKQADYSTISFDIRPTLGWDSATAVTATELIEVCKIDLSPPVSTHTCGLTNLSSN